MTEAEKIMQDIIFNAHKKDNDPDYKPAYKPEPIEINFKRLPRKTMIQALGIHPETFDHWIQEGCPIAEGEKKTALHDLGEVIRWRIEKAENSRKPIKKLKETIQDGIEVATEKEEGLKSQILIQDLRKKTLDNDEREGLLVNKIQMEKLFYNLGRAIKDNIMSKPQVYGPQLEMKTGFEVMTYLLKEFEKLCNSIAGLENLTIKQLEDDAREYHEMFMKGFEYMKKK